MTKHMLIDAVHTDETRVVIVNEDQIEDYDFVTTSKMQVKGNIYLAKITRVEPSLQAAFVEYGGGKQGFLPFSEIHPDYYQIPTADKQRLLEDEAAEIERAEEEAEEALEQRDKPRRGRSRRRSRRGGRGREQGEGTENDAQQSDHADDTSDEQAASENTNDETNNNEQQDVDYQPAKAAEYETSSDIVAEADEDIEAAPTEDDADYDEENEVETVSESDDEPSQRRKGTLFKRYRIQEVIKRNQIVLVQVIKEERGNKGCSLSTYISLAGRYCVLMPNSPKGGGVSRKIGNGEQRKKLKEVVAELRDQRGLSAIIRTAGIDRTKAEIKRDYEYLVKLWGHIREDTMQSTAPALIYEESDIIKRTIRDLYSSDVESVSVQGEQAYKDAKNFMKLIMPSHAARVKQYKDVQPIFSAYDIEPQLASMHEPTAKLPSGGYIVLQQTEALISIDVNSGRSTTERNVEETAIKTNLEAAREIARQLRLRDLAGLVVIDFIDMYYGKNRRNLERAVKDALKMDRAKIQVSRISAFGLMELSRQRLRPSIAESSTLPCPHCMGTGSIRSVETVAIQIIRTIEREAATGEFTQLRIFTYPEAALHLLNEKRHMIRTIEEQYNITLLVDIDMTIGAGNFRIMKTTADGKEILHREEGLSDKRRGRRGRRGGRGRPRDGEQQSHRTHHEDKDDDDQDETSSADEESEDAPKTTDRPARHRKSFREDSTDDAPKDAATSDDDAEKPRRNPRSRRGSRGGRRRQGNTPHAAEAKESSGDSKDDRPDEPQSQNEPKQEQRAEVIAFEEPAESVAAPIPEVADYNPPAESAEEDDNRPKRKGWWNRGNES